MNAVPETQTLLVFTAAALLMNISPGPSNFYVMARSLAQGPGAGLLAALGLAAGSLVHVGAAALGLSALFVYSPVAYTALKLVGAGYLVYLGLRYWLAKPVLPEQSGVRKPKPVPKLLAESALVEILNPKTALFFLAFLPQFVDPAAGPVAPQVLLLGAIVTVTALPCDLLVAFSSGAAARLLVGSASLQRLQARISGTVLIGLGVFVALAKRPAD